jgi:hypothetical protein
MINMLKKTTRNKLTYHLFQHILHYKRERETVN